MFALEELTEVVILAVGAVVAAPEAVGSTLILISIGLSSKSATDTVCKMIHVPNNGAGGCYQSTCTSHGAVSSRICLKTRCIREIEPPPPIYPS